MEVSELNKWINNIKDELLENKTDLDSILLKTQLIASLTKNDNLKSWVEYETDGYLDRNLIPNYRRVKTTIEADVFQQVGPTVFNKKIIIPIGSLKNKADFEYYDFFSVSQSISEIESLILDNKNSFGEVNLNAIDISKLQKTIQNWHITEARRIVSKSSLKHIISRVKSKLLKFLLDFKDHINDENIVFEPKKIKFAMDNIIKHTIGEINANNVNVSIGENSSNTIISNKILDVKEFTNKFNEIQDLLTKLLTKIENQTTFREAEIEILRISTQLESEKPKISILKNSLENLRTISLSITANVLTGNVLEALTILSKMIP